MTNTEAIDVFVRFVEMKEGKENGVVAPHDVFIDACKLAISALQDRPIGHWEIYQSSNRNVIACSCCKQPIYEPQMNYYYCPTCGAKMETQNIV